MILAGLAYLGCRPAPLFSFFPETQGLPFPAPQGAQAPPVPAPQGQQRSGTERAASPGNGAVQGVWGATPTSRETDIWRQRRMSVSSICGNKCTACQVAHPRKIPCPHSFVLWQAITWRERLCGDPGWAYHRPEWCWQRLSVISTISVLSVAVSVVSCTK